MNIVLLGDSIIDNQAYIQPGEPDVRAQLAALCDPEDTVTRLALDGAQIADVQRQIAKLPVGATHLIISAGGNDLLGQTALLYGTVTNVAEALLNIAQTLSEFEAAYRELVATALDTRLPVVLCTVYNPNEAHVTERMISKTAVAIFDDTIIRTAAEHGIPVIDLRAVCTDAADFANPIEPSVVGGEKIARAFWHVITAHDFRAPVTCLYHYSE